MAGLTMAPTLLSVLPQHTDLLALSPEELAGVLIETAPSVLSNGMLTPLQFVNAVFSPPFHQPVSGYAQHTHRPVLYAIAEAFAWMLSNGLMMLEPEQPATWYVLTRRARSLTTRADVEAYRKGRVLPTGLLQPVLAEKVSSLFLRGDHDVAVFQAFKEVEVAVRRAANNKGAAYPDDLIGVSLMRKAFHPESGPLADRALVVAEREAQANLFAGAIGHAKNPASHREMVVSPPQAARLIAFASHLLSLIEE